MLRFLVMIIHLGHVHELVRYPIKSMAGVATNSDFLGWYGLQIRGSVIKLTGCPTLICPHRVTVP